MHRDSSRAAGRRNAGIRVRPTRSRRRWTAISRTRTPRPRFDGDRSRALIAPHAGLMYLGAGRGARLSAAAKGARFDVVVLVGPSHFVGFDGVAIYPRGGFDSPLGVAPIDEACAAS